MERILVIEDEKEISDVLKDYFLAEGYEVCCSYDGADGLRMFDQFNPTLVILDIMLPYLDGIEICRILRSKSETPIMMLSARTDERDKILTLDLGADEYVEKPFSPKVLVAQAKALLRRSKHFVEIIETEQGVLKIDHIEINEKSRTVKVNQAIVPFSPKEYELLVFLMKNPNQVFTKDRLLDAVWGFEEYIDPNTVTVHVRKIREKIENEPANPVYLKTAWGVGYQFCNGRGGT